MARSVAATAGTRDGQDIKGPGPRGVIVLLAALPGFFMLSLDSTAVNVALPGIERDLGGSTAGLQWVIDAYTLRASLLIAVVVLFAAIAAAFALPRRRSENELTGSGG